MTFTAQKQTPAGAGAAGDHGNKHPDSAIADEGRKTFDTLRARLALLGGMGLYELADGSYLVSRAAHCRTLPDLRSVAALARQMGGCK